MFLLHPKQTIMRKSILVFSLFTFLTSMAFGQTVILDFEAPATSTDYQYFGSTLDGTLTSIIANPDATGENTSANVVEYIKPAGAETWAGAFANPAPTTSVDAITNGMICVDVWMDHIGGIALKLEAGGENSTVIKNTESDLGPSVVTLTLMSVKSFVFINFNFFLIQQVFKCNSTGC